jgi:hypothetical protein
LNGYDREPARLHDLHGSFGATALAQGMTLPEAGARTAPEPASHRDFLAGLTDQACENSPRRSSAEGAVSVVSVLRITVRSFADHRTPRDDSAQRRL